MRLLFLTYVEKNLRGDSQPNASEFHETWREIPRRLDGRRRRPKRTAQNNANLNTTSNFTNFYSYRYYFLNDGKI